MSKSDAPRTYRAGFKIREDTFQYEVRLGKPFPWAWLLLLLLPLLLLRCERDITVRTLDAEGKVVPHCSVRMDYRENTLLRDGKLLYRADHSLSLETDGEGLATFEGVRVSVFSFIFDHFRRASFLAVKGRRSGENSLCIHTPRREPLPIILDGGTFVVQVRSRSYDLPIKGATVGIELSDRPEPITVVTDSTGSVTVPGIKDGVVARVVSAGRDGYKPSEVRDVRVGDYDEEPLVLRLDIMLESVDIVMCIDATASMNRPISVVKGNALSFHRELQSRCATYGKTIGDMRLRVIVFRDFEADGPYAFSESDFFEIPARESEFEAFVRGIAVSGGGDAPENALEAIAVAMNSPWSTGKGISRQIVVVWTDAPSHPIAAVGTSNPLYPKGIPTTFEDLTRRWEDGAYGEDGSMRKRLVLFSPSTAPWDEIMSTWTGVYHEKEERGVSITSYGFERLMDSIAKNI